MGPGPSCRRNTNLDMNLNPFVATPRYYILTLPIKQEESTIIVVQHKQNNTGGLVRELHFYHVRERLKRRLKSVGTKRTIQLNDENMSNIF